MSRCAELVQRGDPERFLAVMAAPAPLRPALFTVLAYNLEVARAPWVTQESMIAEMRLQWWRDIVSEAEAGREARAHEVAGPLHGLIRTKALGVSDLDAMAAARRWDIYRDPFADWAAFDAHMDATSGALFRVCARSIGAAPCEALDHVAYASGVAGWLRAVPELEGRGCMPVPDGRPQAIAALAQRGLDRLAMARGARLGAAVPVARMGWLAGPVLRQAVRDPGAVAAGALAPSEAGKRLALMWRSLLGRW